jgi:ketosteroid isomerase-like protein
VAANEIKAVEVAQLAEIDAILRNDLEALDRLWSDDLIMSSNENLIFTKAQVFELFQRGLVQLEQLERLISKSIVKGDAVFLIGNQQLVARVGAATIGAGAGGTLVLSSFMAGWAREDGVWKLVAWHQAPFGGSVPST